MGFYYIYRFVHFFGGFTDGETAYRVAVEVEFGDFFHVLDSEVGVGAALVYAEEHLLRVDRLRVGVESRELVAASDEPAGGAVAGFLYVVVGGGVFYTFVESLRKNRSGLRK